MPSRSTSRPRSPVSLSWVLICALLAALWLAGGASRADVMGQVVARAAAAALLAAWILFADRRDDAASLLRPVLALLGAMLVLALLQLVPLPPQLWVQLPGRALFAEAAQISGQPQPWRPLAIVPGAAVNAALSLIVPFATLFIAGGLRRNEQSWLLEAVLVLSIASMMVGLLQFSGADFTNPLVNATRGVVNGMMANRNHFALLLAVGCLLVPAWIVAPARRVGWRVSVGAGVLLLLLLTILASGSRAGMALGVLASCVGVAAVRRPIAHRLKQYPRWVGATLVAAVLGVLVLAVVASVVSGRAVSVDRAFSVDVGQDMRSRGLPTVLTMIREYFPVGSGLGGFDPLFRLHEPFSLLKPTYFNHAHNDFLEIALDTGVLGLLLLAAAIAWWAWASLQAWRAADDGQAVLPRLGSGVILLILLSSIFDYPARTPIFMAILVIGATWLADRGKAAGRLSFTKP